MKAELSVEEQIAHNLMMVKTYTRRLWNLEEQAARFGIQVPVHIQIEMEEVAKQIAIHEQSVLSIQNNTVIAPAKDKYTILIIDDDTAILNLIKEILSDEGYNVITTSSGLDGLRIATKEPPDLILLDISMPMVPGEEVLKKIKERKIPTRVIMCTTYVDKSYIVKFVKLGACNYVTKPFENSDLLYTVKYSLEMDGFIR